MKNKLIFGKFLLAGALVATLNNSCTNLDEKTYSIVTADKFLKTDEEFIATLGAAYATMVGVMGNHNGLWSDQEVSSDELMVPQRGGDWYDGGQWIRMHRHEYTSTEESFNNAWSKLYSGIAACNKTIEDLTAADATKAKPFLAELKTLRAMYYYWLLDMFGSVPIATQFTGGDSAPKSSTRAEVYAFVEKELNDNVPSLSKDVSLATYGRMNYWAGKALQAKLYLNAGIYTGTPQWAKAQAAADEIIAGGKYSLMSNVLDNFKVDNQNSKENILAIPYDQNFAQGFNLPQMTLHYESQKTYNLQAQPWNGYCSLAEFYNTFDDKDTRKKGFVAGPQYSSTGARLTDDGAEAGDPDGKPLTFTPEVNEQFPNCLRQAGVRIGKFEFANGATPNLSNDFPIFRLGAVMLDKAEALHRLGKTPEALVIVNAIRARAGVAALTAMTDADLLAERGRELFAEGWRRSDLIRFGAYGNAYNKFKPKDAKACLSVFPIPQPQLNANKNLTQNECYK